MTFAIHSTTNYDQFKPLFCNRGKLRIDKTHLARLEESILERNLLKTRPIIVNKDMEIIDGHHRYEIAKKNNLELYYVIENDANYKDAITLTQGTTAWTFKGYIECRAMNGEEDYVKLNKFLEDNKISCHNLFRLFSAGSHSDYWITKVKTGKYKFDEGLHELVPVIKKIHEIFDMLKEGNYKVYKYDKTSFWFGCYKFLTWPEVNWNLLKEQLAYNIHALAEDPNSWLKVVDNLCATYNRKLRTGRVSYREIIGKVA